MKKMLTALVFAALTSATAIAATAPVSTTPNGPGYDNRCQWINGYFRRDGTYVEGHWRGCN